MGLPTAGTPDAPNGATGSLTALTFSGSPPTLLKVAAPERWPPTVVPPKDTTVGELGRAAFADGPGPGWGKETLPPLVSAVSVPATAPVVVGVNVNGNSIFWPADI